MAITILQSPLSITPAANPVYFLVSSDNAAQPNFRFIAVIKDGSGNIIKKEFFPLVPGTIHGWVDLHRTLENYVTHNFDIAQIVGLESSSSWFAYSVEFGEEYGANPAEYLALTISSALRIWNGSLQTVDEFPGYTTAGYVFQSGTANGKWLSPWGLAKRVHFDQRDFMSYMASQATAPDQVRIQAFTAAGAMTQSIFALPAAGAGIRQYSFPSGPENLNLIAALVSGTPGAVILSTHVYYYVRFLKAGVEMGDQRIYTIQSECGPYPVIDAFFLNRFGAVESFRFNRRSDVTREIERATFDKPLDTYTASVPSIGYTETAGSRTQYSTRLGKRVQLRSNWITDEESLALIDLASAPLVYLYQSGELREVSLEITGHREKRTANEKLEIFEMTAFYAAKDRRQSR